MPLTIPHTKRQSITAKDGTALQRQYVYLPETTWQLLQNHARVTETSMSLVLQSLANTLKGD